MSPCLIGRETIHYVPENSSHRGQCRDCSVNDRSVGVDAVHCVVDTTSGTRDPEGVDFLGCTSSVVVSVNKVMVFYNSNKV